MLRIGKYEEVNSLCSDAFRNGLDGDLFHMLLYQTAFITGEFDKADSHLTWFHGRDDEHFAINLRTETECFLGRWRRAQEYSRRSMEIAERSGVDECAAEYAAEQAVRMALLSSGDGIPESNDPKLMLALNTQVKRALRFARNQVSLSRSAIALGLAGSFNESEELIREIRAERPKDTMLNQMWIPVARAAGMLQSGKYDAVVAELEVASRFERAGRFLPQYIRGLAYSRLNRNSDAVNEFERILNNRGEAPLSPIYPLAQLAKARAQKDKSGCEKFFEFWKDADPDMPALLAARSEYDSMA